MDGVRRTMSVNFRDISRPTSASSEFSTTSAGATIDYGYPISEYQSLSFGGTFQHSELLAANSSQQAQDWITSNGNGFIQDLGSFGSTPGTQFDTFELIAGWTFDSRNRALFANRGTRQQLFLSFAVPGSDVEFFQARYNFTKYFPLWSNKWTLRLNAELGIGEALGDTTALPPYKQFYGGGPQSVRGFKESYLGPRDSFGRPYGGNVLVASQLELILPLPDKWASQARASLFYDVGNVFNTGEVQFTDKLGAPIEYKPDFSDLRASIGIGVQWLAPLGLFRFSYAYPLNAYTGNDRYFGDEIERFQFSIGQAF